MKKRTGKGVNTLNMNISDKVRSSKSILNKCTRNKNILNKHMLNKNILNKCTRNKSMLITNTAILTILMLLFFAPSIIVKAEWNESDPIRVGIFSLGSFQGYDENGKVFGYNIEYLNKIAELKHWQYEYIQVENWIEATEFLEQGKIDLLAPAQNIPSLNGRFSYAALPMGTEAAAVYALDTREDLFYEDFDKMKHLRFGGAENSTFTQNFLLRAEEKGFKPDLTYYKNTTELFAALRNKEVDAIITNIMFSDEGLKIIDRFSPLPVYYISSNDNTYLLDQLYEAMCAVELNSPNFKTELMGKYFPYFSNTQFTHSELNYIKEMPEISIGYWPSGRPFTYTDKKTGELLGITRTILDRISEISGLKFQYVAIPSKNVDLNYFAEHQIYAICGVVYNEKNLSASDLWLSTSYFKSENVLVGKEDIDFDSNAVFKLAAISPYSLPDDLYKQYPNFEIEYYDDIETCFEMVRKGKADFLMQNRYVVENYLSKPIYHNMKVFPVQSMSEHLCLAAIHQADSSALSQINLQDSRFLSIINKSIQRIPSDEINDIIIHSTLEEQYQYKISDFIFQYRYLLITITIFLAICIYGLIKIGRMKEHENQVLSRAIEQANHANTAKSQFLSHMSHEIRTPLNAIVGMTALAQKTAGNPQRTIQYLDRITESSKLLMSIINDVLDMSAIESQKMKISNEPFDFKALLTSVSETYYTQCKQKNIYFDMQLDQVKKEMLIGDSLRVNQILLNLLSNAYKFTEPGGKITVTITEKMNDPENKKVFMRFSVADTGCGISKEMQKRLFGAFEQESSNTALKHGGSGLGLAITKNLVDMMHGAIEVESELEKGTKFIVDLPFETTDDVVLADTKKLENLRVMVVDDDSYMREYIASVLSGLGVQFDIAESGETALSILQREAISINPYNVCLVDWKMPEMGGIELVKHIRETISEDILTVIISAYSLSDVEEIGREAGVDLFVSKPLFQSSIYNILASVHEKCHGSIMYQEEKYDFTGKRALLAEDFELNREVAVDLLALVNLETDCAENGEEVVNMFLNAPVGTYDIILMDIQMPIMDGYEAIKAIRKSNHSQAAAIPIYAMTANAFAEDVSKALSAGANGHIAKPIDSKALYKLINRCLMKGDSK